MQNLVPISEENWDALLPNWVLEAYKDFDNALLDRDFPCVLGSMAHKKKLTNIAYIENLEVNKGKKLAAIMSEYVALVRRTEDDKVAGFLPLVVFLQNQEDEDLDDTHKRAWELLVEASCYDSSPWLSSVPRDISANDFIYCFSGEKWFINVSSSCHEQRRSRKLGEHTVLAMQTLTGSNRFYKNHDEKINWQIKIRERTKNYDGMDVYKGLGSLDNIGEPTPLIESYFLPDTNEEEKYPFWMSGIKSFEIVLFDFDGTLADTAQCGVQATQEAFSSFGLNVPTAESIIDKMGIPIEKSFHDLGAAGLSDDEFSKLLQCFREIYATKSDDLIRPFERVDDLLTVLSEQGLSLGIVSSKRTEVLIKNAKSIGIDQYISAYVGSDCVTAHKPNPEGVHLALEKLQYQGDPKKVLYVGDAEADIQMGNTAQIKTCAVGWGAHSKEKLLSVNPDYFVSDMEELKNVILKSKCPFH